MNCRCVSHGATECLEISPTLGHSLLLDWALPCCTWGREKERERGTIRETETGVKVLGSEKPSLPSFAAWTARRYVTALSQEIGYHDQRGIDKGPQWGFWAIS